MVTTTIEQSKKLVELGLKPETADMYWMHVQGKDINKDFWKVEIIQLWWKPYKGIKDNYIPAWSLGALLRLLPIMLKNYWRWILTRHNGGYSCTYVNAGKTFHS